jgi:creatinine amidohydrolase
VDLAGTTWLEVEATGGRSVLAVPLGSTEQHGPHLPLDTDTRVATALAAGLAAQVADLTVAPALAYGASGEHAAFEGTLLVGHRALAEVLSELVHSARRAFRGVVFVSAHGSRPERRGG